MEDESLELCALREAYEETGYQIALYYKIGTFNRPKFKDTQHRFAATVESGKPLTTGPETKELRWFQLNRLPMAMIPNRRKQINCFKQGDKHIELTLTDNHPFLLIQRLFRR